MIEVVTKHEKVCSVLSLLFLELKENKSKYSSPDKPYVICNLFGNAMSISLVSETM